MGIRPFQAMLFAVVFFTSSIASAAIQQHTFHISGNNGETGSGTFTWDDAVVPTGTALANFNYPAELLSVAITISGGNVVGGSTNFTRGDCTEAVLQNTPTFKRDINFWCDNGSNRLEGVDPFANQLNGGQNGAASTLSFSTPNKVPTMSSSALALTVLALGLVAAGRLRRTSPTL